MTSFLLVSVCLFVFGVFFFFLVVTVFHFFFFNYEKMRAPNGIVLVRVNGNN